MAIKVYKEESTHQVNKEIDLFKEINHPHIIKLNKVFEISNKHYFEY